jgi:LytS/YehU family sensor histidine kinase
VLSNSEQPVVRLQEDLNALRLYMEIERMRFQNFVYSIEVTSEVNADFIEVPPLLLQPYVENAIWHGLLHKTNGERKLDVRVDKKDDVLIMEVEDNGIGRERAKSIKMRGGSRKGGLGMKITGDRIRVLKDFYGQEATVEIIDLKNDAGISAGTLVRVCIPVPD